MIDALYKTKARLEQFADKRRMEMHNNKWFRGTDLEKAHTGLLNSQSVRRSKLIG